MSRQNVLVDTGPLVALFDKSDRHHQRAVRIFGGVPSPLITCEAVLSECCFLLGKISPQASVELMALVEQGDLDVAFHLSGNVREIAFLMKKYADVPVSLADACLIRCAELRKTRRIITFDSDFKVYRWLKSRPFEIFS